MASSLSDRTAAPPFWALASLAHRLVLDFFRAAMRAAAKARRRSDKRERRI
jgi:hypothetical protein